MTKSAEDLILALPAAKRVPVGKKEVDGETIIRLVLVYGNDELGYIASSEEWFSPNRFGQKRPEFYEVLFESPVCPSMDEGLDAVLDLAREEAAAAGFTLSRRSTPRPGNGGARAGTGALVRRLQLDKKTAQELRILLLARRGATSNAELQPVDVVSQLIHAAWLEYDSSIQQSVEEVEKWPGII